MRHSIMGERKEIDKERAEIGVSGLWSGAAVPRKLCSGTALLRRVCDAALLRYFGITALANCAE